MNSGGRFYSSHSAGRGQNCTACSAEIPHLANFCMQCGAKALNLNSLPARNMRSNGVDFEDNQTAMLQD